MKGGNCVGPLGWLGHEVKTQDFVVLTLVCEFAPYVPVQDYSYDSSFFDFRTIRVVQCECDQDVVTLAKVVLGEGCKSDAQPGNILDHNLAGLFFRPKLNVIAVKTDLFSVGPSEF